MSDVCTPGSWVKSAVGGFGNKNNSDVNALILFNGFYYAGTTNITDGAEIWRTDKPYILPIPLDTRALLLILVTVFTLVLLTRSRS